MGPPSSSVLTKNVGGTGGGGGRGGMWLVGAKLYQSSVGLTTCSTHKKTAGCH